MSELMQGMLDSGLLQAYIKRAKTYELEHHLDNMRGTKAYAVLKEQVEEVRGCIVRVQHDYVRIH